MNNGRDCEHGRRAGSCNTCDLEIAEKRIAELEHQNAVLAKEADELKALQTKAQRPTEHDAKVAKTAFFNGYSAGWRDCSYGDGFRQNELSAEYANKLNQTTNGGE